MTRIAYLIAVHNNPGQLHRLLHKLNCQWVNFFIHVDKKENIEPFLYLAEMFENLIFIESREKVFWGGWSQVQATLNMINAAKALDIGFDRYVLLSGACYPIRDNESIASKMESPYEFISTLAMPSEVTHKPLSRLDRWFFEGGVREPGLTPKLIQLANKFLTLGPKRNVLMGLSGLRPYAGGNWWALTANTINGIIHFCNNHPDFILFHKNVRNPDESFFHTIVASLVDMNLIKKSVTFADWSHPIVKPDFVSKKHINELIASNFLSSDYYGVGEILFVRKIRCGDDDLLDYIDSVCIGEI